MNRPDRQRKTTVGAAQFERYAAPAVCGLLVLASWLVFGQTLHYGFVNYDDNVYVYENKAIAGGLSTAGIGWAVTTAHGNQWAPLTWISYLVDYQLYGLKPWGYHLTNLVLHALTAVLLFLILRRMTGALGPAPSWRRCLPSIPARGIGGLGGGTKGGALRAVLRAHPRGVSALRPPPYSCPILGRGAGFCPRRCWPNRQWWCYLSCCCYSITGRWGGWL